MTTDAIIAAVVLVVIVVVAVAVVVLFVVSLPPIYFRFVLDLVVSFFHLVNTRL